MKITAFATVFALLVLPLTALAQVSIGPAGVYAQNFAFLGITDYALTNNAPGNLGWYATKAVGDASPNTFVATDGTGALAAGLRNYGSAASADRLDVCVPIRQFTISKNPSTTTRSPVNN